MSKKVSRRRFLLDVAATGAAVVVMAPLGIRLVGRGLGDSAQLELPAPEQKWAVPWAIPWAVGPSTITHTYLPLVQNNS